MRDLNVAVCDDDKLMAENVSQYLKKYLRCRRIKNNIEEFSDGSELLNSNKFFDLIILDIEMEKIDGISTKNHLFNHRVNSKIIFLTDHGEYRDDAYGKNVYGFVSKNRINQLKSKLNIFINEFLSHRLLIITGAQLDTYDIMYIKSNGSYCDFYINNKTIELTLRKNLSEIEKILEEDKSFIRIHRSFIVHLKYVVNIKDNHVYMNDGSVLTVSRTIFKSVLDRYFEYIREKVKYGIY